MEIVFLTAGATTNFDNMFPLPDGRNVLLTVTVSDRSGLTMISVKRPSPILSSITWMIFRESHHNCKASDYYYTVPWVEISANIKNFQLGKFRWLYRQVHHHVAQFIWLRQLNVNVVLKGSVIVLTDARYLSWGELSTIVPLRDLTGLTFHSELLGVCFLLKHK